MRRMLMAGLLAASGFALFAASSQADVIIRGPFGGTIVVPSPAEVRVGPGVMVGSPGPRYAPSAANGKTTAEPPLYVPSAANGKTTAEPPIVSTSRPAVRPETESDTLPPPKVLKPGMAATANGEVGPVPQPVVAPVLPRDFAKTFKPGPAPGSYEVLFLHPVSKEPVKVRFDLPPGYPEVSYWGGSLVFDYGRHEVEIRFKLRGRVVVVQR